MEYLSGRNDIVSEPFIDASFATLRSEKAHFSSWFSQRHVDCGNLGQFSASGGNTDFGQGG